MRNYLEVVSYSAVALAFTPLQLGADDELIPDYDSNDAVDSATVDYSCTNLISKKNITLADVKVHKYSFSQVEAILKQALDEQPARPRYVLLVDPKAERIF